MAPPAMMRPKYEVEILYILMLGNRNEKKCSKIMSGFNDMINSVPINSASKDAKIVN